MVSQQNTNRLRNRRIATAFVEAVNAKTVCRVCDAQPIEWHGEDHPSRPNSRVSSLRTQGASVERIQAEMDKCVPLCRVHHMELDGRLDAFRAAGSYQKGQVYVPPKPCSCCQMMTTRTRNGMCSTCDNHQSGRRLRKRLSSCGCCRDYEVDFGRSADESLA